MECAVEIRHLTPITGIPSRLLALLTFLHFHAIYPCSHVFKPTPDCPGIHRWIQNPLTRKLSLGLGPFCRTQIRPHLPQLPGASMDEAAFTNHLGSLREVLAGFPVFPREDFENEGLGQVTTWATSETIFHEKAKGNDVSEQWKFHGKYIFILTMDESREKVVQIIEFLDSKATEQLRELMARARKNLNVKKE